MLVFFISLFRLLSRFSPTSDRQPLIANTQGLLSVARYPGWADLNDRPCSSLCCQSHMKRMMYLDGTMPDPCGEIPREHLTRSFSGFCSYIDGLLLTGLHLNTTSTLNTIHDGQCDVLLAHPGQILSFLVAQRDRWRECTHFTLVFNSLLNPLSRRWS